ncbi:MAG: DUF5916 domain-containing protein [Gemmatimonadota bacterium]
MLLTLLLATQMAGSDSLTIYNGRQNAISVPVPRIEGTVTIDGSLDELAWSRSALLNGFSQFSPSDGVPSVDSTQVLVWYSGDAIYFGIRAYEAHGAVHATLADRDRIFGDDNIQILLSTFNDGRQATVFMVNPFGVQADGSLVESGRAGSTGIFSGGGSVNRDPADLSPDFVFQSRGRITPYGYEVEVRIPFKSLRFQSNAEQTWGLNIVRQVQHSGYEDSWTQARQSAASFLAQSGHLTGLHEMNRGLVLDLQPEITARVDGAPDGNQWDYTGGRPDVGGNLRWGVTNDLTLNATANPDFSQVESDAGQFTFDPRQALFFPEKRPFFLEGNEQFRTLNPLIYTRRIVQPVAAVKLTGKALGANIGLLSAIDDHDASFTGEDHPVYNILRAQRDVGRQSRVGMVYTDKIDGDNYNRVIEIDSRIVFGGIYSVQTQLAGSRTRFAGARTEAPLWYAQFLRNGHTLGMRYSINAISEDFQAQSGFIGRAGIVNALLVHSLTGHGKPGALLERFGGDVQLNGTWKYDDFVHGHESQDRKLHFNTSATLRGGWLAQASLLIESFGYDPDIYAGYALQAPTDTLPFVGTPDIPNLDWVASLGTPEFSHFSANGFVLYGNDENFFEWSSGELFLFNVGLSWRPTDQIRLQATYQHQQVNRRTDGSLVDIQRNPRLKLEYQVSRPFFIRVIGEYFNQWTDALRDDSRTDLPILVFDPGAGDYVRTEVTRNSRFRGDVLFSFQPNPGTVFFAGYGSTLREPNALSTRLRRTQDAFFVKASYLFRM